MIGTVQFWVAVLIVEAVAVLAIGAWRGMTIMQVIRVGNGAWRRFVTGDWPWWTHGDEDADR
jgi:hypothetical protein